MNEIKLMLGDNMENLKKLPDNSVDSVVTDAPYGLGKEQDMNKVLKDWLEKGYSEIKGKGFMNKEWDAYVPQPLFWKEIYRVLKPGGHVLSFFGTRTYDIGTMAMRLAGFEIRDQIMWIYGSGFPKSHNIGKAVDATIKTGKSNPKSINESEMTKTDGQVVEVLQPNNGILGDKKMVTKTIGASLETEQAQKWEGWGTALKPANEPICVARKPLSEKSVAENVLKWGTGGINVDGTRITSCSSSDKTSDSIYNTIPSHILYELQDTLYKAEPFSLVVESHRDLFPNDVSCVQNWLKLQDYLDDYSIYHHLYDGLLPIFQEDAQVSVQQLHDVLSYISRYEEQSDNPLGLNNHLYIYSLSKIILMFIDRVSEKVDKNISEGRFPANIIFDESAAEMLDEQSGYLKSGEVKPHHKKNKTANGYQGSCYGEFKNEDTTLKGYGDGGGASRFFYVPKVSKKERNLGLDEFDEVSNNSKGNGLNRICDKCSAPQLKPCDCKDNSWVTPPMKNSHPTLKPINLMTYLCRLVTPEGGVVLDPFMGSGSTGIAALLEGFNFIGMELDEEYFKIAEARINSYEDYRKLLKGR